MKTLIAIGHRGGGSQASASMAIKKSTPIEICCLQDVITKVELSNMGMREGRGKSTLFFFPIDLQPNELHEFDQPMKKP